MIFRGRLLWEPTRNYEAFRSWLAYLSFQMYQYDGKLATRLGLSASNQVHEYTVRMESRLWQLVGIGRRMKHGGPSKVIMLTEKAIPFLVCTHLDVLRSGVFSFRRVTSMATCDELANRNETC